MNPAKPQQELSNRGRALKNGAMQRSLLGSAVFVVYRWRRLRKVCMAAILRLEGGDMYSLTARRILKHYHGVEIGAYSYGECMVPCSWPAGVSVGSYVSVARDVQVLNRDHPLECLSTHPFFFNSNLGWISKDTIPFGHLEIGHDAWLGSRAIVTRGCSRIGIGAVVGAGAIVTKDVPDFAIVVGVPARIVRYRFPDPICQRIIASRWWERPIDECIRAVDEMTRPLLSVSRHPLLEASQSSCGDSPVKAS